MLIPGARQAERFVPRRQLHGAGARVLRQRHGQHLDQNAIDVVLGLLLGQAERVHLHAIAETAEFLLLDAVAITADLVPQLGEGAHLAHLGHKADARIHEEGNPPDHRGESLFRHLGFQVVQHRNRGRQREGQLLLRRRPGFLQVIGTHIHRVPFRQVLAGIGRDVGDHRERGLRRADIGAARQVFFHQIVLNRPLQLRHIRALLLGHRDIERQEPRRGRVDRHRSVHLLERDLIEQRTHVAQMADRHTDFAHLAARQDMVAVIAGLGRQVESHGEARLPLGEVVAIERIRGGSRGMARIGAKQPGAVFGGHRVGHGGLHRNTNLRCAILLRVEMV